MSPTTVTRRVDKKEWAQAAGKAKEAAASVGEMASHAASAVGAMANQAASDLGRKVDDLTADAGVRLQQMADKVGKQAPHDGLMGSASQTLAKTVKEGGKYIERTKLSGLAENVAQLIRRNPVPAVLVALGVGWYVGRKLGS